MGARGTMHAEVRWREDTGWEFHCGTCRQWWPLTDEFWRRDRMSRCRACWIEYQRVYQNEKYAVDEKYREEKKAAARLTAWKERVTQPLVISDRKRAYYIANRDRILARERERYWRKKAA